MGVDTGTIVITGASGFIGSWTCEVVAARYPRAQIIGVGRTPGRTAALACPNMAFVPCDLLRSQEYAKLPARAAAVIHLAGDRRPQVESAEYAGQTEINVLATERMADYADRARAQRLVYASSVYVYAGNTRVPFAEEDAGWPTSHLGATKRAGELLLAARARAGGCPMLSFRIFTTYGPYAHESQFLVEAMRKLADETPVARFGAPDAERDFVYVADVAEALAEGLARPALERGTDVLNIGSGTRTPVHEVVRMLAALLGATKPVVFGPAGGAPAQGNCHQADVTKIQRLMGWRARTPLAEGLRLTVEAMKHERSVSGGLAR